MARLSGWVPNQHGAWAMVAAPLLVGVLASQPRWVHLPLAAFWLLGYFAFFATTLWLKSRRRTKYRAPVVVWTALAALFGLLVAVIEPGLVAWAPLFLVPLGVGLVASATRHERAVWSGLATTAGSCMMTVVAYDAGGGHPLTRAWWLTLVLALYFAGTVLYVKTVIRERGRPVWWWSSVVFHGLAAGGVALLSPWLAVVFALLTVRAAAVPRWRPTAQQVGVGEIVATALVATVALLTV